MGVGKTNFSNARLCNEKNYRLCFLLLCFGFFSAFCFGTFFIFFCVGGFLLTLLLVRGHDLVKLVDHFIILKTELNFYSSGSILIYIAFGIHDRVRLGMTVYSKVLLQGGNLLIGKEFVLDVSQLFCNSQGTLLG